ISKRHGARNNEMATQRENDQGCEVADEDDGGDEAGKEPQDAHADAEGFAIGGEEFLLFGGLRIDEADERGAQDRLVDDLVEPTDGRLPTTEELAHAGEHEEE